MGTLYLLDTNILVHFVRDSRVWRRLVSRYDLLLRTPTPLISVVSVGELRALARRNGWGPRRMSQANYICTHLSPVPIGNDRLYDVYATIDSHTARAGRPMGENDIWIAATAHVSGATILTTDHDFDHLAPAYVQLEWFDPILPPGGIP